MISELPIEMFDRRKGHKRETLNRIGKKAGDRELICFRLDRGMIEKLDAIASANFRSRNSEIQARLEASMANESIDEHGVIVVHSSKPLK